MKYLLLFFTLSNAINILHISDIHYDHLYKEGTPNNCKFGTEIGTLCCKEYNIPLEPYQPAGEFGDYNCDSPFKLINETLKWIKENLKVDVIFWLGDSVNHHDFLQSPDTNLKIVSEITDLFKFYLPNATLIPVIGNHEMWIIDQFSSQSKLHQYMLKELSIMWNITDETFLKYGFYSRDFFSIKLIILNSVIWDNYNFIGNLTNDSIIQWEWLENELKISNKPVWIIAHIPPTSSESTDFFSDNFENLMNKYKSKISYSFYGHTHNDEYFLVKDKNSSIGVGFIGPSLVPLKRNSAFRIYQYDKSEIINYQNYYLNLIETNLTKQVKYELLYDFKKEYGINLSVNNFNKLTYDMIKNDTLFNMYCKNYYSGYGIKERCNNKKEFLCDILYVSNNERKNCVI
jgi:hypothetical protein